MYNKITLIRINYKKNEELNLDELSHEDFLIDKDLDLSDRDIASNISIHNMNMKSNFTCKIPLSIWKIGINKESSVELYNDQEIDDKTKIDVVATSINVFFVEGENIYMRDVSFDYIKIGKGFLEYNKKRDCAILNIII